MNTVEETADRFVEQLLTVGAKVPCDDDVESSKRDEDLPEFYDEDLFKKGQQFFHKHIFALFNTKLFGLVSVLAIPSILKILVHTKKSGTEMTAYRRYMATIFHVIVWYDSDFKPGSKLWQSMTEVKTLHNSASQSGCKAGLNRISQKDMALTQFGFVGYQLTRSELIGVYGATPEEWKAFLHIWRVVGHLLGIEDRFNICRGSVAETKAICEKLIEREFKPLILKKDPEFLQMTQYLVNGLWAIQPILNFNVIMYILNILLTKDRSLLNEDYKKLTKLEKCIFYFMGLVNYSLRWAPFRWFHNLTKYRDLWLMKNFPFIAYYKFGYKYSNVKILDKTV